MTKPTARGKGRPSAYRPEFCDILIKEMEAGQFISGVAAEIGVCVDTLYEWMKVHEDFSEAFKIGKLKNERFWVNLGIQNAATGRGNPTMIKFYHAVMHGKREAAVTASAETNDGKKIEITFANVGSPD